MVEEQSAKVIKHPTEPGKLIVDEQFLKEFIRNAADAIRERDQHKEALQDTGNDFQQIKQTILFFDQQFGLFDMMKPGKKISITSVTTKMIVAFKKINNNAQDFRSEGEKINRLIKKFTSETYVLNNIGTQRQLGTGNGPTGAEPTEQQQQRPIAGGANGSHQPQHPTRWQRAKQWCSQWWPAKLRI